MTLTPMRMIQIVLWAAALVALAAFLWLRFGANMFNENLADTIGHGDYRLTATDGTEFTEATLKGAPTAVFFGFTHCPEVCPTTLGDIATWTEELGDTPLRVYFVTVDPERDTPELLKDYVTWVPGVQGVTGSPEEIAKAVKAFRIYAKKVPLGAGEYTMDHSANILLFDSKGRFFEPIGYQEGDERALDKLQRLVKG